MTSLDEFGCSTLAFVFEVKGYKLNMTDWVLEIDFITMQHWHQLCDMIDSSYSLDVENRKYFFCDIWNSGQRPRSLSKNVRDRLALGSSLAVINVGSSPPRATLF